MVDRPSRPVQVSCGPAKVRSHLQQVKESFAHHRHRLEPLGVLVFSVIMITSFVQVALEAIQRLASDDNSIIKL